jgi:hypothetical protein
VAQVSWSATSYVKAGSGVANSWGKLELTHTGDSITGKATLCGTDGGPHFNSAYISDEWYNLDYPDSLFDQATSYLPPTTDKVTVKLNSNSPGAAVTSPYVAFLMGARMSDPVNDPWPSTSSGLTPVDMDSDGKPGVTAVFSTGRGDVLPPTSVYNTEHADKAYVANRVVFALKGTLKSCTESEGTMDIRNMNLRIFGCHDDGSTQECDATETSTLDVYACPQPRATSATYKLVKIDDGATCSDVRNRLP